MRATCLLAALGNDEHEDDTEHARAFTGAVFLAEALQDLHVIRLSLTKKP